MTAVSVVVPTRNRRLLLSEAIATVREQTFGDWELIVVDDASTDDTPEYLATLRGPDGGPDVRTLRRATPGGVSAARNDGLALARGELVMFLDDDDLLRADTLARLVAALRAHPDAVAACGGCRVLQTNGDSAKVYHPARAHRRVVWRELLFGWWANSGQNLYRTAVVRSVGGFDPALAVCEDRKLWLAVARRGPVCLVPIVAMEYRRHDGQSKPADVDAIRRRVWEEFITTALPRGAARREGRRVRRAAELAGRSAAARSAGRFGAALLLQLRACGAAPALLASPLTGRPLWWGVKKSLLRVSAP